MAVAPDIGVDRAIVIARICEAFHDAAWLARSDRALHVSRAARSMA